MSTKLHLTAEVHGSAEIGDGVWYGIGPTYVKARALAQVLALANVHTSI